MDIRPPVPAVNQSTVIFAFLAMAFLIFITVRGELRAYMGFLLSGPASGAAGNTPMQTSASGDATKALATGAQALEFAAMLL